MAEMAEAAVTGTITVGWEDKAGGDRRGEKAAQQDKAVDPKQAKCPCINGIFFHLTLWTEDLPGMWKCCVAEQIKPSRNYLLV